MLLGLRHQPFIRGDHQQCQVDARGAGDHGANEVLVTRHVDHPRDFPAAEFQRREVELDGDLSPSFLRQAIHRASGERGDQGGLAVINVTGGADDHAASQGRSIQNSRAGRLAPSPRWYWMYRASSRR